MAVGTHCSCEASATSMEARGSGSRWASPGWSNSAPTSATNSTNRSKLRVRSAPCWRQPPSHAQQPIPALPVFDRPDLVAQATPLRSTSCSDSCSRSRGARRRPAITQLDPGFEPANAGSLKTAMTQPSHLPARALAPPPQLARIGAVLSVVLACRAPAFRPPRTRLFPAFVPSLMHSIPAPDIQQLTGNPSCLLRCQKRDDVRNVTRRP